MEPVAEHWLWRHFPPLTDKVSYRMGIGQLRHVSPIQLQQTLGHLTIRREELEVMHTDLSDVLSSAHLEPEVQSHLSQYRAQLNDHLDDLDLVIGLYLTVLAARRRKPLDLLRTLFQKFTLFPGARSLLTPRKELS